MIEAKLQQFLVSKQPTRVEVASLAKEWLGTRGEPTDIPHVIMAMKALDQLREERDDGTYTGRVGSL